jgi:hypothetical protein
MTDLKDKLIIKHDKLNRIFEINTFGAEIQLKISFRDINETVAELFTRSHINCFVYRC